VAIALVAHLGQGSSNGNGFTSSSIDTTGASLLVFIVNVNANVTPAVSDNKGNTWLTAIAQVGGFAASNLIVFYAVNPAVGTGHTFTITDTGDVPSLEILAFSATDTTSPLGQTNGAAFQFTTTAQPGSITPAFANEVVVSAVVWTNFGGSGTLSIDSGFTVTDQIQAIGSTTVGGGAAYLVQTSAAPVNPTWTSSVSGALVSAAIASFKAAAAAAAQTPYQPWQQRAPILAM
jgi:hypothetical protein